MEEVNQDENVDDVQMPSQVEKLQEVFENDTEMISQSQEEYDCEMISQDKNEDNMEVVSQDENENSKVSVYIKEEEALEPTAMLAPKNEISKFRKMERNKIKN